MKDERIRYRPAEREAVLNADVQAFCLVNGNLLASALAELFIEKIDEIAAACKTSGPFLYSVSRAGLRRVDL
jgi:hypothetical protein